MRTHGSPLRVIATEYDTGDNVGDGFALRSAPPPTYALQTHMVFLSRDLH